MVKKKDAAAVSLGRRGGRARALSLTDARKVEIATKASRAAHEAFAQLSPEERSKRARVAAAARWAGHTRKS